MCKGAIEPSHRSLQKLILLAIAGFFPLVVSILNGIVIQLCFMLVSEHVASLGCYQSGWQVLQVEDFVEI